MQQHSPRRSFWLASAAFTVIVIALAGIRWSLDHPYGIHWDEAYYFNQAFSDIRILHGGSLHKIGGDILRGDSSRPPAYRLLALPFLALFGLHTATARLVSLAFYVGSAWFIYAGTRRVASSAGAGVAVLVFALSPEVVGASIFFSTEGPLFLATAAMLYFFFICWSERPEYPANWIGLGLAMGLGLLSKASFALIAFPLLALPLINAYRKGLGVRELAPFFKASALAFMIAAPWWLLNIKAAFKYSEYARNSARSSLGTRSLATLVDWCSTVFLGLLGPGLSIFVAFVAVFACWKVFLAREHSLDSVQRRVLLGCACAGFPLLILQISGTNHLLRYLAPAVIPLAIAVALLADSTGWTRSWAAIAISGALLFVQLGMIVAPVAFPNNDPIDPGLVNGALPWRVMVRFDQWDWRPLRDISNRCDIHIPRISYLGNGRAFNPPQIVYPWIADGESPPDVNWLWRYEQGPLNWQEVMRAVGQSDIVLTAPHYVGQVTDKQDLDNQHNAEFAARLAQDPRFEGPIRLRLGRFKPVEVDAFLKIPLTCHLGDLAASNE